MEQGLYIFFFVVSSILLFVGLFYNKDWQMQVMFSALSFVMFVSLAIQGLNVETYFTDGYIVTRYQYTDYYLTFGIPLIFSIIALLNGFIAATYKSMAASSEGLRIPKGFKNW